MALESPLLVESIEILKKYFVFDRIFDLSEYDHTMDQLLNDLKPFVKDLYEDNYRFIFFHYDTEYYINKDLPGLTLLNLQRILVSLDISNYFCLILTQQDIKNQLEYLRKTETTDNVSIASIKNLLHNFWCNNPIPPNISSELIDKKFISLNGVPRAHRRLLTSGLQTNKLIDEGFVSYNTKK